MVRTLRYLFVLLFIGVAATAFGQAAPGEINGVVLDSKSNEPIIGAIVQASVGGVPKAGAQTDIDGKFSIKPIDAGTYTVTVKYINYQTNQITGVIVTPDKTTGLKFKLTEATKELNAVTVTAYKIPLVDSNNPGPITTLQAKEIEKLPTRQTNDAVATSVGVFQQKSGGAVSFEGARSDGTKYIIDGVMVTGGRGINLSQGAIDQIEVMPSGIPAKYGDASGGIVNITTKGGSPTFQGNVLLQHSIDGYNNNLVSFGLSGPLFSKRDSTGRKTPIVSFYLGGDFYYDKDRSPLYDGYYQASGTTLANLRQNPLNIIDQSGVPAYRYSTEFVTKDQLTHVKANPNSLIQEGRLNTHLDFKLPNNLSLAAGGTFDYTRSNLGSASYLMFAPDITPIATNLTGRGWIRFSQKFGKENSGEKAGVISNAYYTIQADYQYDASSTEDPRLKHNIFDYQYVGKFKQNYQDVYAPSTDSFSTRSGIVYQGAYQTYLSYQRQDVNPSLSNYTSEYYNTAGYLPLNSDQVRFNNALMNGDLPAYTYGLWPNVGTTYNGYSNASLSQASASIDASFDLQTGKTRHSIQFGLYYQQQVQRGYSLSANYYGQGSLSLWQLMRSLTNTHIGLDKSNPIFIVGGKRYTLNQVQSGAVSPGPADTITYNYVANTASQSTFDKNLRKKLGLAVDGADRIDIDNLDPNTFSVDMFSADELLNSGNPFVGYYGYTYTGQVQTGQVNFNDFWTATDGNGNHTRPIGAFTPNYTAGYILDKFSLSHINFNLGLRLERYDAANKVLIDPYSLYPEKHASDLSGHPTNIPGGAVVYVDDNNSTNPNVVGYRSGDNWYDASGNYIENPAILKNATGGRDPQPLIQGGSQAPKITSDNFDPTRSFTDYTPAVSLLPRLAFSFPISDVALLYGHYDVYSQRPSSYVFTSPADYYFLSSNSNQIIDNPNLKPERVFDYEMGFQQKLSDNSAVTISAFYKERKDQIQVRPYLYAWPTTYYTYGNRDLSSAKGLTLKYDLRRIGHLRMTLAYTLQFAEGTGTNANTANGGQSNGYVAQGGLLQSFISAGLPNMRYVTYLGYDSRHNFTVNADYRFDEGEGPTVNGKHILQNAGVNFVFRARSGEPYTRRLDPISSTIIGEINGARLPWHYGLDMRLDKDFAFSFRKTPTTEGAKMPKRYTLNAFIYAQNVLNIRDVLAVYGYTGTANDNGYLSSSYGKQALINQTYAPSYTDLYTLRYNGSLDGLYNLPRQIFIGVNFIF
ncbi:MAG: carboxypeptidase regulatory-like domain-containing protein [Flavipsychrobacter sp.]